MRPNALDFSWQRPTPEHLLAVNRDALTYNGAVLPPKSWMDRCTALGVDVTLIFERTSERAQEGFDAGVEDAAYSNARALSVGYSTDRTIVAVVSDGSGSIPSATNPPNNTAHNRIAAYAEAWMRTCAHPVMFYGNRYAVDAATEGARRVTGARLVAGPHNDGGWVPVTWGANKERDPLIQEANTAPPIDGTDENSAWHSYATSAPAPSASATNEEEEEMYVGWGTAPDGSTWTALMDGGIPVLPFSGAVSQYGFFQDGYDYAMAQTPPLNMRLLTAGHIGFANLRNFQVQHPPSGGGGGEPVIYDFSGVGTPR